MVDFRKELIWLIISVLVRIYRGSYIRAHVLMNLSNELGKAIKCEACRAFYRFFSTSLIHSIMKEHEY